MAVILGRAALQGVLDMPIAIDLLTSACTHEAAGRTVVSPKYVTEFPGGSMRMLVACDAQAGFFATKAYNVMEGGGPHFVVSLYRLADGELLAVMDGRLITDLRTGAASGVIARKVPIPGPVSLGIVGSGHQARAQLESLAAVYALGPVAVYSPTRKNREAFAAEAADRLGIEVRPVDTVEAAVRDRAVVATASSARLTEPILRGEWLVACRLLCAVGNTRPQFAEADVRCFADASLVVVDSLHAIEEAGELRCACAEGGLLKDEVATLAQVVTGSRPIPQTGLVAFKSVGTALQDLALASRYYERLASHADTPVVVDLGQ